MIPFWVGNKPRYLKVEVRDGIRSIQNKKVAVWLGFIPLWVGDGLAVSWVAAAAAV